MSMLPALNRNKSFLAPQADILSSLQLNSLILNFPFTAIFNNYKSKLLDLNNLKVLANINNGFIYHPNRNVKIRAFKEFNTVLSSDVLNGLVIFVFFRDYLNFKFFLNSFENLGAFHTLSYFSLVVNGHIANKNGLNDVLFINAPTVLVNKTAFLCNKIIFDNVVQTSRYLLNKIFLIMNAYSKSVN